LRSFVAALRGAFAVEAIVGTAMVLTLLAYGCAIR